MKTFDLWHSKHIVKGIFLSYVFDATQLNDLKIESKYYIVVNIAKQMLFQINPISYDYSRRSTLV